MEQMSSPDAAAPPGPKILVVEDDPELRQLVADALTLSGYQVEVAENGRAALDRLERRENRPAVVLLDLMMPEVNGWEVLEALKKGRVRPCPGIVVFSAVVDAALPMPNVRWVRKPVDIDHLLAAVKAALDASRAPVPDWDA